jgi:nucleoid-associated protein YgaU
MIARAGTCTALSVMIVVMAALILHRAEAGQNQKNATKSAVAKEVGRPIPKVTPGISWVEPPVPAEPSVTPAQPTVVAKSHRPSAVFATANPGESLADLAQRVYGEGADLDALWKINRDQLPTKESELRAGMVLRTPNL